MDSMTIRRATVADAPVIAELSRQLGYPTSLTQATDRLGVVLTSKEHAVLVGCSADRSVVGWIHVFLALRVESDPFAELGGFVVAEQHRGRGIGKRLLAAAEGWAVGQCVPKLRVRSRSGRTEAIAFYERQDFVRTKEQSVLDKPLL